MKYIQTFENFLNEAMRDSSKEYNDMRYEIWYQAPKGYFAKGIGEMKGKIETSYFETSEDAEEHAEAEIDGYLGESLSEKTSANEAYSYTLKGGTIRGSGDTWPDIEIEKTSDTITISQKIGSKTNKVLFSKKQFREMKNSDIN